MRLFNGLSQQLLHSKAFNVCAAAALFAAAAGAISTQASAGVWNHARASATGRVGPSGYGHFVSRPSRRLLVVLTRKACTPSVRTPPQQATAATIETTIDIRRSRGYRMIRLAIDPGQCARHGCFLPRHIPLPKVLVSCAVTHVMECDLRLPPAPGSILSGKRSPDSGAPRRKHVCRTQSSHYRVWH